MSRDTGQSGRAWSTALAVVLLVVQFGLAQHAIEHIPAHLDVACEYCVAGHQPAPAPSVAATAPRPYQHAVPANPAERAALPARIDGAHRVRAPPHHS